MQSLLTFALPFFIFIASTGQTLSQLPQPTHFSSSTFTVKESSL
jgi:hypothetical protein